MDDSLLVDVDDDQNPVNKQNSWETYLIGKKVKLIEDYINEIHENTLVNRIKRVIEDDDFEVVSILSEYFLTLDFILNWGQNEPTKE